MDSAELIETLNQLNESIQGLTNSVRNSNSSYQQSTKTINQVSDDRAATERKVVEHLKVFGSHLVKISNTFANSDGNFADFNSGIGAVGNAALSLGSKFNGVGLVAGMLAKGFTVLMQASMIQADAVIKARNELAKFGSTSTFTVKQLLDMGHNINLSGKELDKFTRPLQKVQGGLAAFGKNTDEAIKKSFEMLKTDEENRIHLRYLGYQNLEDQNEVLLSYAQYLNKSGDRMDSLFLKPLPAALKYTQTLSELAELTGQSRDAVRDQMEATAATAEAIIYTNDLDRKIRNAKDPEEKKIFEREKERFNGISEAMLGAGQSTTQVALAQRQYISGIADGGQVFTGLYDATKRYQDGLIDQEQYRQEIQRSQERAYERVGPTTLVASTAMQELVGGIDTMRKNTQLFGNELPKITQDFRDYSLEVKSFLQELENSWKIFTDNVTKNFDPILSKDSLGNALAYLGVVASTFSIALAKGLSSLSGLLGSFGSSGIMSGFSKAASNAAKLTKGLGIGGLVGISSDVAAKLIGENTLPGAIVSTAGSAVSGAITGGSLAGPYGAVAGGVLGGVYGAYQNRQGFSNAFTGGKNAPATSAPATTSSEKGKEVAPKPIAGIVDSRPGELTIKTVDGDLQKRISNNVAWRFNNPGNIRGKGTFIEGVPGYIGEGNVGKNGFYSVFRTPADGENARKELLFSGRSRIYTPDTSIREAMSRYAPSNENPTESYIRAITATLGVPDSTRIRDLSDGQKNAWLSAISKQENITPGKVVQAAKGGIFEGPTSGYPATLHGRELIAPLNVDSILSQLAKTPASDAKIGSSLMGSSAEKALSMNTTTLEYISAKMDRMISALEEGNYTSKKILQTSRL